MDEDKKCVCTDECECKCNSCDCDCCEKKEGVEETPEAGEEVV